jgi:anti-sigma B factor antagonist
MPMEVAPAGAPRTFRLAGELDLLNAEEVEAKLEPDSKGQGDLVLDLTDLAFIDSSGIRVLIRTAERLEGRGRLILRSPNRQVQVVLSLVGVARDGSGIVVEGAPEHEWGTAVTRTFPAERAVLAQIRAFVRRRAVEDAFGDWSDGIVLAVSEASANAVVHSGSPEVQITWRPYADHAEVEVRDEGTFRGDIRSHWEGGGNRGFLLMMSLMDQVSITCGTDMQPGSVVRMVKNRSGRRGRMSGAGSSDTGTQQFLSSQQRVAS